MLAVVPAAAGAQIVAPRQLAAEQAIPPVVAASIDCDPTAIAPEPPTETVVQEYLPIADLVVLDAKIA